MYPVDWRETELFFYRAMKDGWISGAPMRSEILVLPGYRVYRYVDDELMLIDMWTRTPLSNLSSGVTTIYQRFDVDQIPIWSMHYRGWYDSIASDLVKKALRDGHEKSGQRFVDRSSWFRGCRGPERFDDKESGRSYLNVVKQPAAFHMMFSGKEEVITTEAADRGRIISPKESFGWHDYAGGALVPWN